MSQPRYIDQSAETPIDQPAGIARPAVAARGGRLFGRADALQRVLDTALSRSAPPLLAVTGGIGIGRSALLTAARDRLVADGVAVLELRIAESQSHRRYGVAARLRAELDALRERLDGGARTSSPTRTARAKAGRRRSVGAPATATGPRNWSPTDARPRERSVVAQQLAASLDLLVGTGRTLVIIIDDAQWIDPSSLNALVPLVGLLAGSGITLVCGYRRTLVAKAAGGTSDPPVRLRESGLLEVVPLRPLNEAQTAALLTDVLHAKPSSMMLSTIRRSSRGMPAAILAAAKGHQRSGSLRVVDRHAYLLSPSRPPELPGNHRLLEHLRRGDALTWPVAKAIAVLHPLGEVAGELVAKAVGIGTEQVSEILHELWAQGVLILGPQSGQWRFRLPLLAPWVATCLGPFERRKLAQLAVTAIWDGSATTTDQRYLPEALVAAGKLVDTERAAAELVDRGATAMLTDGYFARRWLRAGLETSADPALRARALLLHAATSSLQLAFADAVASARTALNEHRDRLDAAELLELEMIYIISLCGMRDTEALRSLAEDGWRSMPGGAAHQVLSRTAALCYLDRWVEADDYFTANRGLLSEDEDAVAAYAVIFGTAAATVRGRMTEVDELVANLTAAPPREIEYHHFLKLASLARILLGVGDLDRVDRLLTTNTLPASRRPTSDLMIAASLAGRWDEAINLARVSLANGSALNRPPAHTVLSREMATILTARGHLVQARSVIENARAVQPMLTHLLAVAESDLELNFGSAGRSRQVLVNGLMQATESGFVIGTDQLWLRMAEAELSTGDLAAARRCVDEAAKVAELLGTGRARLCQLIARVEVYHDSGTEAVRLARHRAQPFELAGTLAKVAISELVDGKALLEAYELYGELDALLPRARLRRLMRERDIVVPGRSTTVAENERLLAALITEGLTNRELAIVLGTSEKGAESRLSRLFQRTGYRSRVELATAMLIGEYPA